MGLTPLNGSAENLYQYDLDCSAGPDCSPYCILRLVERQMHDSVTRIYHLDQYRNDKSMLLMEQKSGLFSG